MSGVFWFICAREADTRALPNAKAANFGQRAVDYMQGLRKSRRGIGDLVPRPNGKAVRDCLLCDGSAVSRSEFPQLFAEIGTEWGAGDGVKTFNLPSLNGMALPYPEPNEVPMQTVQPGGTVSTGQPVEQPTEPAETGGTTGNVTTGGVNRTRLYGGYEQEP